MAWKHGLVLSLVLTAAAPTLAAQARADVALTLRLAGEPRSFHPGELIPIELEFTSPFRKRFVVYDNWGARRDLTDEFRVDPDRGVSDPLLDFLALGSCMDCGFGIYSLDGEPMVRKLDLNEWFRFDEPGTYRVSLLSKSVHRDESLVVPVESNTITVEILPRDERWEAEHVAALIARVDQRRSFERLECRGLQFLGTHAAVDAMIRRFDDPDCQSEFVRGLFGAPDREYVVRQMAGWISAPDQSVSQYYLRILALLSVYLDHPEFRPAQTALTKGRPAARGALSDNRSLIDAAIERFQAAAVATRGNKDPRARAITVESAFQAARPGPERDALRADVIATFLDLPTDRQRSVLEHHWASFNVPAMLPVLRRLSATPVPDDGYAEGALVDLALRRWWQLAPAEARPAILEHIAKPGPGDTIATLGALPDRTLPSLDAALAANLLATDDESRSLAVSLFERYATGAVEGAGGQAFDAALQDENCEAAAGIVAYLARVDAAQSRAAMSRMRSAAQGGCRFLWLDLQKFRMSPAIEEAAIGALSGTDPADITLAARLLAASGSAAGREPLFTALERWHGVWKDHLNERAGPNAPQLELESALTTALTFGSAWQASAVDLERVRQLCVTDACREDMARSIARADRTEIRISYIGDYGGIELAQYYDLTLARLEARLKLYPKGSVFTLNLQTNDPKAAAMASAQIRRMAEAYGLVIK